MEKPAIQIWQLARYEQVMRNQFLSPSTIRHYARKLVDFVDFCQLRGLTHPDEVTPVTIAAYMRSLSRREIVRRGRKTRLKAASRNHYLAALRGYFAWLASEQWILGNPAEDLPYVREPKTLPRVFTFSEARRLLAAPDPNTVFGLRDKALFEVLYSTAIRPGEALALKLHHIDPTEEVLFVHQGKGRKDRMVPIGERALAWLDRYLEHSRPQLAGLGDSHYVFLSRTGRPLGDTRLGELMQHYLEAAGIGKPARAHTWRHTCATHLSINGMDIRAIQLLLGHASITTTQQYIHIGIRALNAAHAKAHPSGTLREADIADLGNARPLSSRKPRGRVRFQTR